MTQGKIRKTRKKENGDYIDNERFLEEITEYRKAYFAYKENPRAFNREPQMSEFLGTCFFKIATNLSKKGNFYGYPYKEDMVADGYFDCIKYAHVFNPEKTNNPFAYFTQVCYYAFIRKIGKEKKHYYTICKAIENSEIFGLLNDSQAGDDTYSPDEIGGYTKESRLLMSKFVEDFETSLNKKKPSKSNENFEEDLSDDLVEVNIIDESEITEL